MILQELLILLYYYIALLQNQPCQKRTQQRRIYSYRIRSRLQYHKYVHNLGCFAPYWLNGCTTHVLCNWCNHSSSLPENHGSSIVPWLYQLGGGGGGGPPPVRLAVKEMLQGLLQIRGEGKRDATQQQGGFGNSHTDISYLKRKCAIVLAFDFISFVSFYSLSL